MHIRYTPLHDADLMYDGQISINDPSAPVSASEAGEAAPVSVTALSAPLARPRAVDVSIAKVLTPGRSSQPRRQPELNRKSIARLLVHALRVASTLRPDEAPVRRWGVLLVCTIVLAMLISVLLSAVFFVRTQSAMNELQLALVDQARQRDEQLLQAVRSDLRHIQNVPAGQMAQAIDALADRLDKESGRQMRDAATELRQTLADEQRATRDELAELRAILVELNARQTAPAAPAAAKAAPAPVAPAAKAEAPAAAVAAAAFAHAAVPAPVVEVVYLVDASQGLRNALPRVLTEVRRSMEEVAAPAHCRIVLMYGTRLFELPGDLLLSGAATDATLLTTMRDLERDGPASIGRAVQTALAARPRAIHLFSDNLGESRNAVKQALDTARGGGAVVHVTHFHTREHRESFKSIARDHGGSYFFIPQG